MFYNRFASATNAKNFELLSTFLDGMGVRRLKNNVGHSVEFESFSTVKPTSNVKVSRWIDEIAEILQSVDDGSYQIPIPIPKQRKKETEKSLDKKDNVVSESQLKETLKEEDSQKDIQVRTEEEIEGAEIQLENEVVETSNAIGEDSERLSSDDLKEEDDYSSPENTDFSENENM